jgi:hypothetical protein
VILLHVIKGAFVVYSGAHNIQASLLATGDNIFAVTAQIVGVLVLEITISALYMAGMAGRITGRLQSVIAAFFWLIGIAMASAGIIADSRLHAGYELGELLSWYISTGLFLAPVVMVVGAVLGRVYRSCVGSEDRQQPRSGRHGSPASSWCLLAEKAAHESRRIVHNIRLGAQRQMAIEAKKYYRSPAVQAVLQETAVSSLQDVLRQAGINVSASTHILPGGDWNENEVSEVGRQPSSKTARSDGASGN